MLISYQAVSYTHLDVYKRQSLHILDLGTLLVFYYLVTLLGTFNAFFR